MSEYVSAVDAGTHFCVQIVILSLTKLAAVTDADKL